MLWSVQLSVGVVRWWLPEPSNTHCSGFWKVHTATDGFSEEEQERICPQMFACQGRRFCYGFPDFCKLTGNSSRWNSHQMHRATKGNRFLKEMWEFCHIFTSVLYWVHQHYATKTDFTSARLAAVKSWLQCAFILPLVFWHKLPSPSSELQLMTNFPIYTQAFKGYLHYCSIILRKFSLVTIWRCVGETASIFRGKKKPKKRNHLQSQMEGEPQIFATLLPLQPAFGCTGHWHTAGCSLAWCLCGWFDTLCASNPDPEEPAGKREKEVNQQTV